MRSPDFEDVLTIWDSYHANHAQKVCALLRGATMMTTGRDSGEEGEEEDGRRRRRGIDWRWIRSRAPS